MTAYHTICGKTINKSTRADTTGNRDTEACAGCPHLLPWGGEFDFETHSFGGYKGYECRMPQSEIRYETEFAGSVNDKCTCRVSSLDFDFLALISTWIKETYPDGELSGAFSMDKRRGADYVSAGRFCLSIYCAQNKKGMAAKAALRQRFFDDRGKRLDLSPDDEREKVLADIRRGIEAHKQNSETSEQTNGFVDSVFGGNNIQLSEQATAAIEELFMEDEKKVTIYRDPATGWLYRVSPKPEQKSYWVEYLDPANSAIWKPFPGLIAGNETPEGEAKYLALNAKRKGWVEYQPEENRTAAKSPCDDCRCPDCTDYDCDQAGCDKSDCGLGCMAPDDQCPPETEKNYPDERLVRDKTSSCPYFAGVTSHTLGNKVIENVNCDLEDHPLSIACYTYGCKDAVETCRIYWLGRIADELGREVPEYLQNCQASDLQKYFEEETEKCKNNQLVAPNSSLAPVSPAAAGVATLSRSDADAACLAADPKITPFDYSGLDPQTVATLHSAEAMITDARQGYIVKMADAVGMAHDELVANCEGHNQHSEETFVAWCKSVGLKKDTAYRLLQVSNLISASSPVEQSVLEQASPSLLYAAAKPSAPAELVHGVKDGNITTHKQYKELEAQLKAEQAAREKAEKDAAYFRADSEQARAAAHKFHTKADTAESKLNQTIDRQAEYAAKVTEAEHKAREAQKELAGAKQALEAVKMRADRWQKEAEEAKQQPIETTVVDQSEVERRAAELAAEQTATLKRQIADLQATVSSTTSEDDQHNAYDAVILACRIFDSAWQTARGQWGKIPPNLRQAARDMINKKLNDIRENLQCL